MEFLNSLLGKSKLPRIGAKELLMFDRLGRIPYDNRFFFISKSWLKEWKRSEGEIGEISHTVLRDKNGKILPNLVRDVHYTVINAD
jgi:hypothetical protein